MGVRAAREQSLSSKLVAAYTSDSFDIIGVPDKNRSVLIKCLSRLRRGRSVLVFSEFNESDAPSHAQATLLGLDLPAPEGAVFLSAVSGAPLVPVHVLFDGDIRLRLVIRDPISVPWTSRAGLQDTIRFVWDDLEQRVLRYADQWLGWQMLANNPAVLDQMPGSAVLHVA